MISFLLKLLKPRHSGLRWGSSLSWTDFSPHDDSECTEKAAVLLLVFLAVEDGGLPEAGTFRGFLAVALATYPLE